VSLAAPIVASSTSGGPGDSQAPPWSVRSADGLTDWVPAYLGRAMCWCGCVLCLVSLLMARIGFNVDLRLGFSSGGPTAMGALQLSAGNLWSPGLVLATVAVNLITCGRLACALRKPFGELPLAPLGQRHGPADGSGACAASRPPGSCRRLCGWPAGACLLLQGGLSRRPRPGDCMAPAGTAAGVAGKPRQLSQQIRQRGSGRRFFEPHLAVLRAREQGSPGGCAQHHRTIKGNKTSPSEAEFRKLFQFLDRAFSTWASASTTLPISRPPSLGMRWAHTSGHCDSMTAFRACGGGNYAPVGGACCPPAQPLRSRSMRGCLRIPVGPPESPGNGKRPGPSAASAPWKGLRGPVRAAGYPAPLIVRAAHSIASGSASPASPR